MNGAEIMKNAMDEFKNIQEYMMLAKEENAVRTYAKLKDQYLLLKALLASLGVNLTDIDKIKEQNRKRMEGLMSFAKTFRPFLLYKDFSCIPANPLL